MVFVLPKANAAMVAAPPGELVKSMVNEIQRDVREQEQSKSR